MFQSFLSRRALLHRGDQRHRQQPRQRAAGQQRHEHGFSELTIAGLLGHASRGVTQRYIHLDKALVLAANRVAAEIAQFVVPNASVIQRNAAE